jgi:hypothetical protein
MTFKGVPIDGTLDAYVTKMVKSGFTNLGTEDGIALLEGDFAGFKNCTVGVSTLDQKDLVSKVAVFFPEKESWASLSSDYFHLKELLIMKYGTADTIVEKFETYSEPSSDYHKMLALKEQECVYTTIFKLPKGNILLTIVHTPYSDGRVLLTYYDKVNTEAVRQTAIDDL